MEFYVNDFGEEMGKDQFISLQSLIKRNEGLFKSEKQGNFIHKKWTLKDLENRFWIGNNIEIKDHCKYILVEGYTEFSHGKGRGHVPITYLYEIDHAGILTRYRAKYRRYCNDGTEIKEVVKDWERSCETPPAPEKAPEAPQKPQVESEWFGEEGTRYNGLELTVEFVTGFETQFGWSNLHKFRDKDGNLFVWFTSSKLLEQGQTYRMNATVKRHSEFRDQKQTELTRCMKIEEI